MGYGLWPGDGLFFKNLPINLTDSGVLFILFCTVNWLDVDGLNIEVLRLTSDVGGSAPSPLRTPSL